LLDLYWRSYSRFFQPLGTVVGFFNFFSSQLANVSFVSCSRVGTLLQPHVIILWVRRACRYVSFVFESVARGVPHITGTGVGRRSSAVPLSCDGYVTRVVPAPYTAETRFECRPSRFVCEDNIAAHSSRQVYRRPRYRVLCYVCHACCTRGFSPYIAQTRIVCRPSYRIRIHRVTARNVSVTRRS